MKENDYSVVRKKAEEYLQTQDWELLAYVSIDIASMLVANIYMMNDLLKAYGQDMHHNISIIASRNAISTIFEEKASHYKSEFPLCMYENLEDDLAYIITCIDASLLRMQF